MEWPPCEIADTALRCAVVPVALYFIWDIKKREIPPLVVRFRVAWLLVMLAGSVDRAAFVSGKVAAIVVVDFVQLPASYFAASFLLQHASQSLFDLAFATVPKLLTRFLKLLPVLASIVVCAVLITFAIEETEALYAAQLIATLTYVALMMGTVGACYLRLYFYIKGYRREINEKAAGASMPKAATAERERDRLLKKASSRALVMSAVFWVSPALVGFLIARQFQGGSFRSKERFVPELCDSFAFVWITPVIYILFLYVTRINNAKPRSKSHRGKQRSLQGSSKVSTSTGGRAPKSHQSSSSGAGNGRSQQQPKTATAVAASSGKEAGVLA